MTLSYRNHCDNLGFRGKTGEFVDGAHLPSGDPTPSFRDFTFTARAKITGGHGTWRTIIAHSECEGFQLAVDSQDEVVFEQTCSSSAVQSGFKPALNEWFHVAVTYYQPEKHVTLFINGKPVSDHKLDNDVELQTHLAIGRSSGMDSDYFIGEITAVRGFDYVLNLSEIQQAFDESLISIGTQNVSGGGSNRRTLDGRLCLTPCSAEEPMSPTTLGNMHATNVPIGLSCDATLKQQSFNGRTDQAFRITCPEHCLHHEGTVKGSKLYSPDSQICKAAIHAGVLTPRGGDAVVTLHNGINEYKGSRGHGGKGSCWTVHMDC
eukprot:GHVQ01041901.1.p1 GENE.GHVQ01041901.1~~GHVQ01041901.1.p1  ORF type:complete len:320 (+),score=21.05 GHVQ01041901.1:1964-2923(+)